ncbi:probable xyloglucan endotransglucosylase/hydrolase protein 33 [Dioscorea cayenensis subsp. rotundata]|uniref:Xyloglucan endotransglucosylase/hydrolase n=1 Tax=Dioscorea cayennensis subsp. rotundata TaxID=55577 RepID=A0AB40BT56_DIOCR|nr:probable xyloglucan endotransglucosylase/hydrolase protein 33 [Dioscorea cayenensis subsp. rotundata]
MTMSLKYNFFLLILISFCFSITTHSLQHDLTPPNNLQHLTNLFPHLSFNKSFSYFFGSQNIQILDNGSYINLILNKVSGSGFKSLDMYYYGFFSASIKLPSTYSAGVVVAFYMSNSEVYPKKHDEIDIELLGHEKRKEWVLQTNVYGDGSVSTGREEKFYLWFDPSQQFHEYTIIWNPHHIVFMVDNIPVREVNHSEAMSTAYPSKPMSMYSTIWDGSDWATHGGKKPVNYNFAPFIASFKEMEMEGCVWNQSNSSNYNCSNNNGDHSVPMGINPIEGEQFVKLSEEQKMGMKWVRDKFMFYSYCKDLNRFKILPPECK